MWAGGAYRSSRRQRETIQPFRRELQRSAPRTCCARTPPTPMADEKVRAWRWACPLRPRVPGGRAIPPLLLPDPLKDSSVGLPCRQFLVSARGRYLKTYPGNTPSSSHASSPLSSLVSRPLGQTMAMAAETPLV